MAGFIVPPGGFAGFNQMTPSSRRALSTSSGPAPRARRRKRTRASAPKRKRASTRARKGGRKMKFGSPAWQKKYKVGRFAKK